MRKAAIVAAILAFSAGPALAQQGIPGVTLRPRATQPVARLVPAPPAPIWAQAPVTDDLDTYMQGTGVTGAAEILQQRDHLGLSTLQTQQLELLRDEAAAEAARHLRRAREARRTAAELFQGDNADLKAYEVELWQVGDHKLQAQLATARVAVQALGVLTRAQRETLARMQALAGPVARPVQLR